MGASEIPRSTVPSSELLDGLDLIDIPGHSVPMRSGNSTGVRVQEPFAKMLRLGEVDGISTYVNLDRGIVVAVLDYGDESPDTPAPDAGGGFDD